MLVQKLISHDINFMFLAIDPKYFRQTEYCKLIISL